MMAIEQMTSGVAMAFLMSFMMFFFNPIIGTLSMIGLVIGLTVLRLVRQRAAEHSPIYQAVPISALHNNGYQYLRHVPLPEYGESHRAH